MSEVAKIILSQLGGNRFVAMIGAKAFVYDFKSLQFAMPRNRSGANKCRVTLNANDLYDIEFFKIKNYGLDIETLNNYSNVDCEALAETFANETGFILSL